MSKTKQSDVPAKVDENANLPAVYEYGNDAGAGIADATREELSIPFLTVLQALSPQVTGDTKLPGAEAGMLFNTVTGDLMKGDEGVLFVPAFRQHVFVEWVPRNQGGGFVAIYEPTDEVVIEAKNRSEEFGKYKTEAGNDLVETFYLYGIILDEDGEPTEMAVLAFTSTKVKKYKATISKMRYLMVPGPNGSKINPPLFANTLRVTTVPEKNKHGAFYNFNVAFANGGGRESLITPDKAAYQAAKELADAVSGGRAKADHDSAASAGDGGAESGETSAF